MKKSLISENIESSDNPASKKNHYRCTSCLLPSDWGIINFDAKGVCNYCNYYESVRRELRDFNRWQQIFASHLDTYRGKYDYDVIVGFSGGKDSTYILYMLKEVYQCRVLAVTVNFGFMPTEPAKENINRVIENLNVDHVYYSIPDAEVQSSFRTAIRQGRLFCEPCTTLCWLVPRKIAIEKNIPFYIMGSDRGQIFRAMSPETAPLFRPGYLKDMLTPYSEKKSVNLNNPKFAIRMQKSLEGLGLSKKFSKEIYPPASYLPETNAMPMELLYFLFHPYKEKEIKQTIAEKISWKKPDDMHLHSHHDCDLHDAANIFFRKALGTTLTTAEISVDVREGEVGRKEALDALKKEGDNLDSIQNPYAPLMRYFNISSNEVNKSFKRFKRKMKLYYLFKKVQLKFIRPKIIFFDDQRLKSGDHSS